MNNQECSRCGNLYKQYNTERNATECNAIMFVNTFGSNHYYSHGIKNLCPGCMTEVVKWFNWGVEKMNVLNCIKKTEAEKAYEKGKAEGKQEGVNNAVQFMLYAFVQYFGDERGWKTESVLKGIRRIHRKATMILEGYTSYQEIKDAVKEEYGIVIEDGQIKFDPSWIKEA